jgi:glycerol-3-phosphate dehydrogenase
VKYQYDLIVIGGGATGSGIALDATLRGLNCLLLEQNDFAQGTSSRSTKLVHGGVRYLEAAIKNLDLAQFNLVKEGLKERYRLLKNASFLAKPISLITPLYKYYEIPYIYIGLSIYDFISGKKTLGRSSILSKQYILDTFPYIKKDGLKGGVKYFDGIFNDSKMVISLLQTAKKEGCDVYNYKKVVDFLYKNNIINGVKVQDRFTNEIVEISSKYVVNATGIFADSVRKLDDKTSQEILNTSSGLHIVIHKKFLPNDCGVMIPKTKDGRVLFMLPLKINV